MRAGCLRAVLVLAMAVGFAAPAHAQSQPVDLTLVLAVDCSRSINDEEFALQVEGYAAAFRHPAVLRAIQSGERRAIAVTYVQWAGPFLQNQAIGWTLINDGESAHVFADRFQAVPRAFHGGATFANYFAFKLSAVLGVLVLYLVWSAWLEERRAARGA